MPVSAIWSECPLSVEFPKCRNPQRCPCFGRLAALLAWRCGSGHSASLRLRCLWFWHIPGRCVVSRLGQARLEPLQRALLGSSGLPTLLTRPNLRTSNQLLRPRPQSLQTSRLCGCDQVFASPSSAHILTRHPSHFAGLALVGWVFGAPLRSRIHLMLRPKSCRARVCLRSGATASLGGGYRSKCPTFAVCVLYLDNERWSGVPLILKAVARTRTHSRHEALRTRSRTSRS